MNDEEVVLNYNTTAADVPGWDSLTFVMLQCEVEEVFGVKFASTERITWVNIGDWVDCILEKLK